MSPNSLGGFGRNTSRESCRTRCDPVHTQISSRLFYFVNSTLNLLVFLCLSASIRTDQRTSSATCSFRFPQNWRSKESFKGNVCGEHGAQGDRLFMLSSVSVRPLGAIWLIVRLGETDGLWPFPVYIYLPVTVPLHGLSITLAKGFAFGDQFCTVSFSLFFPALSQ